MSELMKRVVTDTMTAVCLIYHDGGLYEVSVDGDRLHYNREFDYLGDALDFFEWAVNTE